MSSAPPEVGQWQRIAPYLDQALDLQPPERERWLTDLTATEPEIAAAVRQLLDEHAELQQRGFLSSRAIDPVRHALLKRAAGVGEQVGAYRLIREIGRGGMSSVWLAERSDGQLQRDVALKLPFQGPREAEFAERFKRERDILATLTHPNIARLYDAGVSAVGQPYLAMEHVDGKSLTAYCDDERLSIRERLRLFLQVLAAVEFAHSQLVLHRDLKPSNILVTRQARVVLLDFGIAKLLSPDAPHTGSITEFAEYPLTPDYASPEQLGGQPVGTASDIYSLGVATFVERAGGGLWESAAVAVNPSGRVTVRTGSHSQGQGHETTFAQIAADALGIPPQAIVVQQGDSAVVPRGVGTFSSRSTTIGGSAALVALEKIKTKATRIAAHLLEAAPEDIVWDGGRLHVKGMPGRSLTFEQVAAAAYEPGRVPRDLEMGLEATGHFALPRPVFPFGAHAAVVEVERETGALQILRLVAVDDAGRIVNPLLAEGQVIGSATQGLGQILTEEVTYDESGQPQNATFAEYGLLRAPETPSLVSEFLETPSPINPLGAKGIGEAGCIGIPAAIANAVADALAPLGVRHVDVPFSPARLWRLARVE